MRIRFLIAILLVVPRMVFAQSVDLCVATQHTGRASPQCGPTATPSLALADVQYWLGQAVAGDRVILPAGTTGGSLGPDWDCNPGVCMTINKNITVIGQGSNATTPDGLDATTVNVIKFSGSSGTTQHVVDLRPNTNDNTLRLTGIHFHMAGATGGHLLDIDGASRCWIDRTDGDKVKSGLRIDHCHFSGTTDYNAWMSNYWFWQTGWVTGVMDHCLIENPISKRVNGITFASGNAGITATASVFTAADVGSYVEDGFVSAPQFAYIVSVQDGTHATMSKNATTGSGPKQVTIRPLVTPEADENTEPCNFFTSPDGTTTRYGKPAKSGYWAWYAPYKPGHDIAENPVGGPTPGPANAPIVLNSKDDTSGDAFYFEDNIFYRAGNTGGGNLGGERRVLRHNTMFGWMSGHGLGSGGNAGFVGREEYNNKQILHDPGLFPGWNKGGYQACTSQSAAQCLTWPPSNQPTFRSGSGWIFNNIWQGFKSLWPVNFFPERFYGSSNCFGPSDGTNFLDNNAQGNQTSPTVNSLPQFRADGVQCEASVSSPVRKGGENCGTHDTRIGDVYAYGHFSDPSRLPTDKIIDHPEWPNGGTTLTLVFDSDMGTNNGPSIDYRGYILRNDSQSPVVSDGAQDLDANGNVPDRIWAVIMSSTNLGTTPASMTINIAGTGLSITPFVFNTGNHWTIRKVNNFFDNFGTGANSYANDGKNYKANKADGRVPLFVNPAGSPPPTQTYYAQETFGVNWWNIAVRLNSNASWQKGVLPSFNANDQLEASLVQGHYNVNGSYYGSPTGGSSTDPSYHDGGAPPGYYPSRTGTIAERRIGADWDGDPSPPLIGATNFGTVWPNLSPSGTPTPALNWTVAGSKYPHPLIAGAAASAPVFSSPFAATFLVGTASSCPDTNCFVPAVTGTAPITFSNSGNFPSWASFDTSTGKITGNPPSPSGTPYAFTIKAVNSVSGSTGVSHAYTLEAKNPTTAPTVTLSTDKSTYTAPATVQITTNPQPGSGASITQVLIRYGTTPTFTTITTLTSSPWTYSWAPVAAGAYALTAIATDNSSPAQDSSPSPAVNITVNPSPTPGGSPTPAVIQLRP